MRQPVRRTNGGAVQRGAQRGVDGQEESPSLLDYILACLRDPRGLTGVGSEGLEGRRLVWQLVIAFAAVTYVSAAVVLAFTLGFGADALAGGLVGLVMGFVSLLALTVAFWFMAGLTGSKVGFRALLTGLTFVQIMAVVVLVLVALAGGLAVLAGVPGKTTVSFLRMAYFGLMMVYTAFFAMGIFDVGCLGSSLLAFVAALIASFLPGAIAAGLGALFGG